MILFLVVFCVLIAVGFSMASAISDFRSMTIPNIYSALIILAFVPAYAADFFSGHGMEYFADWSSHALAAILVFAITFVLFVLKVMGAGDSKLCSALALWVGVAGLPAFLFYMAVTGAVLGIITKILNKKPLVSAPLEGSWIDKSQKGQGGVPYGIAICVGAIVAFYMQGYFSPETFAALAGYTENEF
jgi:prepilin peptidase CpaA